MRIRLRLLLLLWLSAWFLTGSAPGMPLEESDSPSRPDQAISAMQGFIKNLSIDKSNRRWRTRLSKPPVARFSPEARYYWTLHTSEGSMKFLLMPEVAPMHVSSTIYLTLLGFYDGLDFHRIIPGFMAQGGCPAGNGRGNPGYRYDGEFDPDVQHDRPGLLSMANAGRNTDGSQFFITFEPTPHLDGEHTIFGEMKTGQETLEAIEQLGSRSGKTTRPVTLERAEIRAIGGKPEADETTGSGDPIEQLHKTIDSLTIDREDAGWRTRLPRPPKAKFDPEKRYFWHLETNKGKIVIRFMPEVAPMHVSSTIYLTLLEFYDGLTFHRVIPEFMAQGGCPIGDGSGSPGYKYGHEGNKEVRHDRPGLLSMANAGKGTDGSQFFITFAPTPHLDGKHSIFGEVVEGKGTLEELEKHGSRRGTPSERLVIETATVTVE